MAAVCVGASVCVCVSAFCTSSETHFVCVCVHKFMCVSVGGEPRLPACGESYFPSGDVKINRSDIKKNKIKNLKTGPFTLRTKC